MFLLLACLMHIPQRMDVKHALFQSVRHNNVIWYKYLMMEPTAKNSENVVLLMHCISSIVYAVNILFMFCLVMN